MKKLIWILIGIAVVIIIAAFFLIVIGPHPGPAQIQSTSAETLYINQSNTFGYSKIKLINITSLKGQTYAVLYVVGNNGAQPTELYIGNNQFVAFGNGGAPYIIVNGISSDSAIINIVQNIPSGFTEAINNGRQGNFIIPNEAPIELLASTWTTDKPANYSNLVTIVFSNATRGVKYEFENNNYMAQSFNYKINNKTIQMTLNNSTTINIPFTLSGDLLTLNYKGQTISLNRDWQNMTFLTNKY